MNAEIALFVFIPFCKIKCTYCDFNVYAHLSRWMEPYADAVAREIGEWRLKIGDSYATRSIYFGGGTPSLMSVASIEKMLRACKPSQISNLEVTLEANPGNADEDKLCALHSLGITRLSIGAQSFTDATLRRLNRGHTVADTLETFECARRVGFDNINLDFIYGLPLQTRDDWRATLERALALAPEHLSLYGLKVEDGTGLAHQIARGKYPMPDDDLAAEMYELAEERLDAAGYEQYEISNWAKNGDWRLERRDSTTAMRSPTSNVQRPTSNLPLFTSNFQPPISNLQSRHNLTYWRNESYLGFGAGAHSCFGGERFWNVLSPLEYIQRIERGESVVAGRERISRALEMAETMILGLRLNEGIVFAKFAERYGADARAQYARQLNELRPLGLLEWSDERVRLTPRGRLLSNEVFWRFLP